MTPRPRPKPVPLSADDETAVRAFYRFLAPKPPLRVELRVLAGRNVPGISRFADTEEEFAEQVRHWNGRRDVYAGPALRLRTTGRSGRLHDVGSIAAFAIDIDARPTNPDDAMHAALSVAESVMAWFCEKGFARPVRVWTGGGVHLWFAFPAVRFDEQNVLLARVRRRQFAQRLAAFVNEAADAADSATSDAHVDRTVKDLPRILRVPGTRNFKRGGVSSEALDPLVRVEDGALGNYLESIVPSAAPAERRTRGAAAHRGITAPVEDVPKDAIPLPPVPLKELLATERRPEVKDRTRALLRGDLAGRRSASEAEFTLCFWLARCGYSDRLISKVVETARIPSAKDGEPKWLRESAAYRSRTLARARASVKAYRFRWAVHGPSGDAIVRTQMTRAPSRVRSVASLDPEALRKEIEAASDRVLSDARELRQEGGTLPTISPRPWRGVRHRATGRATDVEPTETRFTLQTGFAYSPDPGLSLLRLDKPSGPPRGGHRGAYGQGVWFEGALLRAPATSKATQHIPADGSGRKARLRFGAGSPRSGFATLVKALGERDVRPAELKGPVHVAVWRRGSRAGASFSCRIIETNYASAVAAQPDDEVIPELWPREWMLFQKGQRRRARKRGAL